MKQPAVRLATTAGKVVASPAGLTIGPSDAVVATRQYPRSAVVTPCHAGNESTRRPTRALREVAASNAGPDHETIWGGR
jgi:hypothetical protein